MMKKHLRLLPLALCITQAFGQVAYPTPAASAASSVVTRITTKDGSVITIDSSAPVAPSRPANALNGGVVGMYESKYFPVNYKAVPPPRRGTDQMLIGFGYSHEAGSQPQNNGAAFRTIGNFFKFGQFDPQVYPGIAKAGHLHAFFCNTAISGLLTAAELDRLSTFGNSTCAGGIGNRSSYWVPALIDSRTGIAIIPMGFQIYYKNESVYRDAHRTDVVTPPQGLRFIAGNPSATSPSGVTHVTCNGNANGTSIPSDDGGIFTAQNLSSNPDLCAGPNVNLQIDVSAPGCWDGVNLSSPDHKSHMAYESLETGCPSTHPKIIPKIDFQVFYSIKDIKGGRASIPYLRLSSDNYPLTTKAGYSGHFDWNFGWDPIVIEAWVNNCLRYGSDCHVNVIDNYDTYPYRSLGGPQ